jgi:TM2 domain-containing membrane protein YozV|tara:strand:+ start:320 stop:727 length:408 start_codon:yes stop_codon:yes gene_type:complete
MNCSKCNKDNPTGSKFCSGCGGSMSESYQNNTPPPNNGYNQNQRPAQWKSEGTTLVLTIILGIFGLGGIGHIYLGNITRGFVILIAGFILLIISAVTFGIGLIILIPFAIWVVFDSRKQCKYYNDHLEQTGRPPW